MDVTQQSKTLSNYSNEPVLTDSFICLANWNVIHL